MLTPIRPALFFADWPSNSVELMINSSPDNQVVNFWPIKRKHALQAA
jgi:hypothetical protein